MHDVEISRSGGVQTLRLTRAAKKNALTVAMYNALADALDSGDSSDDVRVNVFLGSGGIFSAGNDIAEFLGHAKAGNTGGAERFIRTLPGVKKPLLAEVDGPAVVSARRCCFTVISSTRARLPASRRRFSISASCRRRPPAC